MPAVLQSVQGRAVADSVSVLERQQGTNQPGPLDQPQPSLGYSLGIKEIWKNVGPHPHLHLGGEVKSLANNEVQRCCDELTS